MALRECDGAAMIPGKCSHDWLGARRNEVIYNLSTHTQ